MILKDSVNDPGLAFTGKVGLGPFWTLVQALSYAHVSQLFQHERVSTVRKIYMKMHMQDLFNNF
jgi:hypothetical protein